MSSGPASISALMMVEKAAGESLKAAIELSADHAAASGKIQEESIRLRESFLEMTGKGLMVAAVVGLKGMKGAKAVKPGAVQIKFNYASEGAAYSLRVDPLTGKGPMHIDSRNFTRADSYTITGAPRNKNQFWQLWKEKYPETMSAENLKRVTQDKLAPIIDNQWISHFPEHQKFLSETLYHHHIDYGDLVTALPYTVHVKAPGRGMFHDILGGKND